ncbi:MAG TPA: PH domain-containing protein [Rhizomicrobium sp.]|nr:PH domain-containing protein [Rhizomicrobium sp.]
MASYVDRVLQPGETVRYVGTLHWIIFLPASALLAFGVVGLATIAIMPGAGHGVRVFFIIVVVALLFGVLHLISAWIRRQTTEIAVTNHRIIYKVGLFSIRSVEMNMDKVESVDVKQDIIGRLLDYGTVTIRGTGAGLEPLVTIASPLALRNAITVGPS